MARRPFHEGLARPNRVASPAGARRKIAREEAMSSVSFAGYGAFETSASVAAPWGSIGDRLFQLVG